MTCVTGGRFCLPVKTAFLFFSLSCLRLFETRFRFFEARFQFFEARVPFFEARFRFFEAGDEVFLATRDLSLAKALPLPEAIELFCESLDLHAFARRDLFKSAFLGPDLIVQAPQP